MFWRRWLAGSQTPNPPQGQRRDGPIKGPELKDILRINRMVRTTPAIGQPYVDAYDRESPAAAASLTVKGEAIYIELEGRVELESLKQFLAFVEEDLSSFYGYDSTDEWED